MRYWDSSALVATLVEQPASEQMRMRSLEDPAVVTWWGTPVECVSAIARLAREGAVPGDLPRAVGRLRVARAMWAEIGPSNELREQAIRLVRVHGLRAGDALQLGAALVAANLQPSSMEFVTLDSRQADAAEKEGFRIAGA